MFLHRLVYRSDAALVGTREEIDAQVEAIVAASAAANAAAGVTGALLLASGVFVQVLEGPLEALEDAFERICGDLRHRRVRLLKLAVVEERVFAGWSMVRVPPEAGPAQPCPALRAGTDGQLDSSAASATVRMMRAALRAGQPAAAGAR